MHKSHQQNPPPCSPAPDDQSKSGTRSSTRKFTRSSSTNSSVQSSKIQRAEKKRRSEKKTLKIHLFTFCASCFENFPVSSLSCVLLTVLCAAAAAKRRAPIAGRFLRGPMRVVFLPQAQKPNHFSLRIPFSPRAQDNRHHFPGARFRCPC